MASHVLQARRAIKVIREPVKEEPSIVELTGFNQVFDNRITRGERLMWLITCIALTGICLYQISDRINVYINDESSTYTYYATNKTVQFPSVTFCPPVDFLSEESINSLLAKTNFPAKSVEQLDDLLRNGQITVFDLWNLTKVYVPTLDAELHEAPSSDGKAFRIFEIPTPFGWCLTAEPRKNLEFQVSELSVKFKLFYNRTELPRDKANSTHLVYNETLTLIGIQTATSQTERFNADEIENLNDSFVELNEAYLLQQTHENVLIYTKGYHIIEKYFALAKWSKVRNGLRNFFIISLTQINRRTTRKQPCSNVEYVVKCMVMCFQRYVYAKASKDICKLPFMVEFQGIPICSSVGQIRFMTSVIKDASQRFELNECECVKTCQEILYISQDEFVEMGILDSLTPSSEFFVSLPVTSLVLQILENKILILEDQMSYSWLSICCDVGGTMGLWLGICGLQLVQLFTDLISKLKVYLSKRLCAKTVGPLPSKECRPSIIIDRGPLKPSNITTEIGFAGIQNVFNVELPVCSRLVWLLIYLATLALGLFQCYLRISYFMSDPSFTKTYYEFMKTAPFPAATFCPDSYDTSQPVVNPYLFQSKFQNFKSFSYDLLESGNINISEIWTLSRIHMTIITQWISTSYDAEKKSEKDHPDAEINTTVGLCFTMLPLVADFSASPTTLIQGIEFWGKNDHLDNFRVSICTMILHDPEDNGTLNYLPNLVGYKFEKSVDHRLQIRFVKIVFRNTLNKPCQDERAVANCINRCVETSSLSQVRKPCRLPYMLNSANVSLCTNEEDLRNIMSATSANLAMLNSGLCKCPRSCNKTFYSIGGHVRRYKMLDTRLNWKFSDDKYLVIEEYEADSIFSLCSDVGGFLGLFLGFCALQLVEILSMFSSISNRMYKSHFKVTKSCNAHHTASANHPSRERTIILRGVDAAKSDKDREVTVPGFNHVMNKDKAVWARSLWLLISLLATATCVYQCTDRIMYFLLDPSDVITYYNYNTTLFFPTITLTANRRTIFYKNSKIKNKFFRKYKKLNRTAEKEEIQKLWNYKYPLKGLESSVNENKQGHPVTFTEVHTLVGITVVIQPNITAANLFHEIPGEAVPYRGLRTTLCINITFDVDSRRVNVTTGFSPDEFLRIPYDLVENPNTADVGYMLSRQYIVTPFFIIRPVEFIYRNTSERPCVDGKDSVQCMVDCFEKQIRSKTNINCRTVWMQRSLNLPPCTTFDENDALYQAALNVSSTFHFDKPEDCSCPRKCRVIWYSNIKFRDEKTEDFKIFTQVIFVNIPDNRILVLQEEQAYTIFKLLSDIGGTVGLYFGFGFMQMFEILVNITLKYQQSLRFSRKR